MISSSPFAHENLGGGGFGFGFRGGASECADAAAGGVPAVNAEGDEGRRDVPGGSATPGTPGGTRTAANAAAAATPVQFVAVGREETRACKASS
jgi:hypothetical protein